MNSKALLTASLNHQNPGKVPVDFGGTPVSGMHISCVEALRNHFGLCREPVKVCEPYQMLGIIGDELKEHLGIDTYSILPRNNMFGFANENWKEFVTSWGQEILVPGEFHVNHSSEGELLIYPQGDMTAMPSGRMPGSSFFFDSIIRQNHFDPDNLDPEDNLEEFRPLSPEDLDHYKRESQLASAQNRAVVAVIGGLALGDIALVPAPFLKDPRGIRDVSEWYMSTALRPDYI